MQGKTHILIGSAASLFLLQKFGYDPNIITTAAAAVGALIPDIDHPKSMINQKVLPVNNKLMKIMAYAGGGTFLIYQNIVTKNPILTILGLLLVMIGLSHHRGFTHSILGIAAIYFMVYMFKSQGMESVRISFIIGMVSHLAADYFTTGGIEIFYPVSKKNFSFPITLTTGGIVERLLSIGVVFIIINSFIG